MLSYNIRIQFDVQLAISATPLMGTRVQIFNQVSEVHQLKNCPTCFKKFADVEFLPNPRKELAENELRVSNQGLKSLVSCLKH